MTSHRRVARALLALLLMLTMSGSINAQSYRGSIVGTVTDQTGAVVAKSAVWATAVTWMAAQRPGGR